MAEAGQALRSLGTGATASRLMAGTLPLHTQLEERLAAYKGYPSCLVFGSGVSKLAPSSLQPTVPYAVLDP